MTCIRWTVLLLALGLGGSTQAQTPMPKSGESPLQPATSTAGAPAPRPAASRTATDSRPGFSPNPYGHGYVSNGTSTKSPPKKPRKRVLVSPGGTVPSGWLSAPYCSPLAPERVTVLYVAPPPPMIVVEPPPIVLVPRLRLLVEGLPLDILPRNRLQALPEPPEPPWPGQEAGVFRPLAPDNRARALRPLPPEQLPPKPMPAKPDAPKPAPKPPAPPPLPRPPAPEDDPQAEYNRLLGLGRTAFAAQEYGRAAQRFQQATRIAPNQPLAHFLLAQVLLALGKYRDAVEAIHGGLARQPDWPTVRFQPLELYGPNVADYPEHLRRLEGVLQHHPDDPVLLFLYAYQLWFDGRKEEARLLFQRALPGAADPDVIQGFLRALPAAPAV